MKRVINFAIAVCVALMAWSCNIPVDEPQGEPQLEVSPITLDGIWKLEQWRGESLAEGAYVYMDIERSGRAYTLYQNIDSFYTNTYTGIYYIYTDETLGKAVVRGIYDHSLGDWNHRYIVESLTADTMRWVALDNKDEVCEYVRVAELPADIAPAPEEEE